MAKRGSDPDSNEESGLLAFVQKYATDEECRQYLEAKRWPKGPVCPRCDSNRAYKLKGKSTRDGLYKCGECRKPFTVTIGTIFESSHIPLPKWFAAIYLMCSSKKGISAHQLHRSLKITYKTAWFMCHRIRHSMKSPAFLKALSGNVQVDETYVGGKPRKGTGRKSKPGRGTAKTPVVALVAKGKMRTRVVADVTGKTLRGVIRDVVKKNSTIVTDDNISYRKTRSEYHGGHVYVNHSKGEYVKNGFTTNTVESFFALLKRGVHGTFHQISKEHLQRYCDEFEFRWNNRKEKDWGRALEAISLFHGKRLMYCAPKSGQAEMLTSDRS
jgi:transposase-like protein